MWGTRVVQVICILPISSQVPLPLRDTHTSSPCTFSSNSQHLHLFVRGLPSGCWHHVPVGTEDQKCLWINNSHSSPLPSTHTPQPLTNHWRAWSAWRYTPCSGSLFPTGTLSCLHRPEFLCGTEPKSSSATLHWVSHPSFPSQPISPPPHPHPGALPNQSLWHEPLSQGLLPGPAYTIGRLE